MSNDTKPNDAKPVEKIDRIGKLLEKMTTATPAKSVESEVFHAALSKIRTGIFMVVLLMCALMVLISPSVSAYFVVAAIMGGTVTLYAVR